MHFRKTAILLALALSVAGTGCKQQGSDSPKADGKKGVVLAEVNGVAITDTDFYKELEVLPPELKPMAETPEGKKELLDSMMLRELVMQQAKKEGLDKSEAVAARLETVRRGIIFNEFLKKKIEDSAKISDADMQDFYKKNQEKFRTDEQVRVSHLLMKTEAEAKEVEKQLKAGAKFDDLVKAHSIDGTAAKGGDLGWVSKGRMLPAFEKVAFGLKEGQTSGVVKTQFGYHIIKLTGRRPAGLRTLDEVKDQIKAALVPEKQQATLLKLKDDLKKGAKLTIKDDALKGLKGSGSEPAKAATADPKAAPAEAKKP